MANEKILAAFQCAHDDGDQLVVVGATTAKEFRAAVVDAELVRMHAHEEGTEHDQPLHAFAAWRFDEECQHHVWDLDVEKDTPGARPAMVANAYWAEACEFVAGQMHVQLLSMLGAKDHAEAGGIIGKLQAGAMHAAQKAVQQSDGIEAIVTSLGAAWLLSTRGDWGSGDTLGETVARGAAVDSYKVADFRHTDDAKFCALAHANLPRLLNELDALRSRLASPTQQGLDAQKFLNVGDFEALERFAETTSDDKSYDIGKTAVARLAGFGCLQSHGFGRYSVTSFGNFILNDWDGARKLPFSTQAERDVLAAAQAKQRGV